MADALQNPLFTLSAKLRHFRPLGFPDWNTAFQNSVGGASGRVVSAEWLAPYGDGRRVKLKLLPGPSRDGSSIDSFLREVDILQKIRHVAPPLVHRAHLSFTYCMGWEKQAINVLPSLDLPHDVPLCFIAMEPLEGGTLWDKLGLNPNRRPRVLVGTPLTPPAALLASADFMAGLSALHRLGFAHGDIK